jgi:hypothetical protein
MSTRTTYLIVPALTDLAGQCRIVRRPHHGDLPAKALQCYRNDPDSWEEAGLMNSRGRIVCLDAPPAVYADMQNDEPLAAGLVYTYDANGVPA